MYLARTDRAFPFSRVAKGSIVTIGAFDGLHLGHRRLLGRVLEEAAARDLPAVVMSFEPTPKEYFAVKNPLARLTRFREKYDALNNMGIDIFYCPNFNAAMRNITVDAFIRKLLVHAMNVRHLVIGDDFAFARNREGNPAQLRRAGRALKFSVEQMPSVIADGKRVSSTAIRDALRDGEMQRAEQLLGMCYRMSGKVVSGNRRQREEPLVFVNLQRRQSAVQGIFAVRVGGIGEKLLDAVAYIGRCVSAGLDRECFALHIAEIDRDLGGSRVDVDFIARVSGQKAFESVGALVERLHRHMAEVRTVLAERRT